MARNFYLFLMRNYTEPFCGKYRENEKLSQFLQEEGTAVVKNKKGNERFSLF